MAQRGWGPCCFLVTTAGLCLLFYYSAISTILNLQQQPPFMASINRPSFDSNEFLTVPISIAKPARTVNASQKQACPKIPPFLATDIQPVMAVLSWDEQDKKHKELTLGGTWQPSHCHATSHVAILVPYQSRDGHLHIFMNNLHPFLQKQELHYGMYVMQQAGNASFNRAKLLNVGFVEAMKDYPWDCVVLHGVDLLPVNEHNLYTCSHKTPKHLALSISRLGPYRNFRSFYRTDFGGVSMLSTAMYRTVNGMSNLYWGWGGEDNDLYRRCHRRGLVPILRYPTTVARYVTIGEKHLPAPLNKDRDVLLSNAISLQDHDGLDDLTYKVLRKDYRRMFTYILTDIGKPAPGNIKTILKSALGTRQAMSSNLSMVTLNKSDAKISRNSKENSTIVVFGNQTLVTTTSPTTSPNHTVLVVPLP